MTSPSATPSLPATAEAIDQEIDKITSLVAGAETLLADHKQVDLGALEGRVSALCAALAQLPEGEAPAFRERLEYLLAGLDSLEKALSAEHESLSSLLSGETRAKEMAAARSYGSTPPPSTPDDDGESEA